MSANKPSTHAEIATSAPIETVFAVLANPWSYGYWVVGSDHIREADSDWPASGSEFKHVVGVWPLKSHDLSYVEAVEAPTLLRLRVNARPFVKARVWIELSERGTGTNIRMFEDAADFRSRLAINPLTQPLVKLRNKLALKRLRELAEGDHPMPTATTGN